MVKRMHHEGITRVDPGKKPGADKGAGHRSHSKGPHKSAGMPSRTPLKHIGTHNPMSKGTYHGGHRPGRKGESY